MLACPQRMPLICQLFFRSSRYRLIHFPQKLYERAAEILIGFRPAAVAQRMAKAPEFLNDVRHAVSSCEDHEVI